VGARSGGADLRLARDAEHEAGVESAAGVTRDSAGVRGGASGLAKPLKNIEVQLHGGDGAWFVCFPVHVPVYLINLTG